MSLNYSNLHGTVRQPSEFAGGCTYMISGQKDLATFVEVLVHLFFATILSISLAINRLLVAVVVHL